ncbi:MAG: intradiol ring-cleavage dioxygenase [Betaproteobacteria bacterium]|jgi:protocatechuate 3,4-dioxygenase beta subunit|nr:MAG: intradiol ring-cleavage dioxygenase [Betaproteobacteria bacterium]
MMKQMRVTNVRRRTFIAGAAATPLILAAGGLASKRALAATPSCGGESTPPQTAGPFFKPDSPRRVSLVGAGMQGERLKLTGRVLSTACQPISGALIDFWHCDANGRYDNSGYTFRGHQFSDAQGGFSLETLLPGIYPGRTRHIHVIVQAPNRRPLTTQLYFPGEAFNRRDFIFDPKLLMTVERTGAQRDARFDFVLDLGRSV